MKLTKAKVARQFGKQSRLYATSQGHAYGDDLAILIEMLQPTKQMKVLDVATGAGHTAAAVAPLVESVVATDLTPEMVQEAQTLFAQKKLVNATAKVMDVDRLDFQEGSFDAVTCRIAPHHFLDIEKAVGQISKVLRVGGVFVLEDNVAPPAKRLDQFINDVEKLRDPTHVRSYTVRQWRGLLKAHNLKVTASKNYRKTHNIEQWIERSGISDAAVRRVYQAFSQASEAAIKHYDIVFSDDGKALTFTDDKVILVACKRA